MESSCSIVGRISRYTLAMDNGLVEQYAPKDKTFDRVDDALLDIITYKFNH